MIRLTEAPLKTALLDSKGDIETPWIQYLTELQDSTAGYWGRSQLGVSEATKQLIQLNGNLIHIYITFDEVASDTVVNIPDIYTPLDGPISAYTIEAGSITVINYILVSGGSFTIPATNKQIIISGTLLRDLGE